MRIDIKKLPPLLAVFFSASVSADVYVCHSEIAMYSNGIGDANGFSVKAGTLPEPRIYIVDTDQGWRISNPRIAVGNDFRGECNSHDLFWICTDQIGSDGYIMLSVNKDELTYNYSQHMYGSNSSANDGNCTRV